MQSVFWDLLILMTVALTAAVLLGRICVPRIILQLPDEQKAEDDQAGVVRGGTMSRRNAADPSRGGTR